jgi:transposase
MKRALHKIGLNSRIARRKPFINDANKAKRLAWCLERERWSVTKWKSVFFTDEKSFTQFEGKAQKRVWRAAGEEFSQDCLAPTVSRSQTCMVWGGFSWQERAPLVLHSGSVTGAVHAALLKEDAIPSFKSIFPRGNGIFQQDNAPVHTAKVAKNALKDAKVKMLPWPAYSPDLNPIENLWSVMERNLRNRNPPGSITELRRMLREEWNSLSQDMLRDLIESMPRRVRAVIDANGGATCY